MSLTESFLAIYPVLSFFMVNGAICAVLLPNRFCNTRSTNKHWLIVCLIVAGLFGVRSEFLISFSVMAIMIAGAIVHYVRIKKDITSGVADVMPGQTANFIKRVK